MHVSGAKGLAPTDSYKVCATYADGYRSAATMMIAGRDAVAKAQATGEAILKRSSRLIREAGQNGARVVGFPEGFVPAHPVWYHHHAATSALANRLAIELFKNAVEIPGPETEALCNAARDANAYVAIGVCEKLPNTMGTLFNSQLYIAPDGRIIRKHQKIMPTVGERLVHMGGFGDTFGAFQSEFGPMSGLICGENSNPLAVFALTAEGTRIHVMSWPNHFPTSGDPMRNRVSIDSQAFAQMSSNEGTRALHLRPAAAGGRAGRSAASGKSGQRSDDQTLDTDRTRQHVRIGERLEQQREVEGAHAASGSSELDISRTEPDDVGGWPAAFGRKDDIDLQHGGAVGGVPEGVGHSRGHDASIVAVQHGHLATDAQPDFAVANHERLRESGMAMPLGPARGGDRQPNPVSVAGVQGRSDDLGSLAAGRVLVDRSGAHELNLILLHEVASMIRGSRNSTRSSNAQASQRSIDQPSERSLLMTGPESMAVMNAAMSSTLYPARRRPSG